METAKLKKFAQFARRSLLEQVSSKLKLVLAENSAARRESTKAIKKLEEAIKRSGKEQVIERVAYIWFNRFCALRFMDENRYNRVKIVSPADPGQFQPEILAEAKMGHIDEKVVPDKARQQVFALLDGKAPSRDPQGEAYRLLVVAACNFWNKAMPFLFQRIDDYTELLMPDDLLSGNSILAYTREAMTPDACEDVEVIGWLYQFYISEKKDDVFAGLKKNKKITPENIPAATQLFTPHWIVRYLVENSLGRLWLLNRPASKLTEQMDYYIKPEEAETDFLRITKPEEIKICDPACGSGHMLTYAFDLLYAIYEEEGVDPTEIPEKILTNNLYGIEIDERAGELAAFALTMKARAKQRRFFNKGVKPNICVLENVHFDGNELKDYMDYVGRDLFTTPLQTTLRQFEEADNFGSLIRPDVTDVDGMLRILESKNVSGQLFISMTHQKVLQALRQADYLSPKYHVVIANPPYMGVKGMNDGLKKFLSDSYKNSKADLMTCFMVQSNWLCMSKGYVGMINLPSWMFLSTFEKMRAEWLSAITIQSLLHLGRGIFGADFGTVAFTIQNKSSKHGVGVYYRLFDRSSIVDSPEKKEALFKEGHGITRFLQPNFFEIPGAPLAYWLPESAVDAYRSKEQLSDACYGQPGLQTSNNEMFIRAWSEVSYNCIGYGFENSEDASQSSFKWFPYLKGGEFRKWYGNHDFVVDWENNGERIKNYVNEKYPYLNGNIDYVVKDRGYYFKKLISYTKVTIADFGARASDRGFLFDVAGSAIFPSEHEYNVVLGFMCSKLSLYFAKAQNPTVNLQAGDVDRLPFRRSVLESVSGDVTELVSKTLKLETSDWNDNEKSWDFTSLPLLNPDNRQPTLKATYQKLRTHWRKMTLEMQRLEEENNRIFIEAYGLQDELTPDVPLNEITLTCNPHNRYGNDKSEDELEALLLADTMRELVSYAVGCMFGRYALDKPGLILANQGETIKDYLTRIPEPSFPADTDNVIPMLDDDWFTDDICERFQLFLKTAFGAKHYEENLQFVEESLNIKGKRKYSIRDYFLSEFYTDHVRRYKKRPIYWLFSSPKGSFNALIYMHRYQKHTASTVLKYLRDFKNEKLRAHKKNLEAISISAGSSQGEKTKALKTIDKITKILNELDEYEREVLYPLAAEQVEINLDDGVKVNYPKFGAALKKVAGLSVKKG